MDEASKREAQAGADTPSNCDHDVVIQGYPPQRFLGYDSEEPLVSPPRTGSGAIARPAVSLGVLQIATTWRAGQSWMLR